jgi:hypothetical protein
MASGISDAFTIGVILLLIFGAVCFYLYTRIQQTEKRLNLCENILLDLKVAAEHGTFSGSTPAPFSMNDTAELLTTNESRDIEMETDDINAMYERAIDEAYETTADELPEDDTADVMIEKVEEVIDASVYDSLNVKELKSLAKQHHIAGASSMSRNQLIDALVEANVKPESAEPLTFSTTSDISATAESVSFD